MKRKILALVSLVLLCGGPALAQDNLLAQSQGYELRESHLVPAVNLLNFLAQGQITQEELNYLVQSSVAEFQTNPVAFLTEIQQLNQAVAKAQTVTDPLMLGKFRYTLIGEFFASAQQVPANQMPAFFQVLFRHANVVAFDPNTKVPLTEADLLGSLTYVQELGAYQGRQIIPQELNQMAQQLAANFGQLDAQTQNFLASGMVVLNVFRANVQQMNQQQQAQMQQAYQQQAYQQPQQAYYPQGTGGQGAYQPATSYEAKQWENYHNQQTFQIMQDTMNQNHVTMMNVIEGMGGSDNYWTLEPTTW